MGCTHVCRLLLSLLLGHPRRLHYRSPFLLFSLCVLLVSFLVFSRLLFVSSFEFTSQLWSPPAGASDLLRHVRVCFDWFIDASWGGTLAMAGAACVRTHKLHPYTFGQNVANK